MIFKSKTKKLFTEQPPLKQPEATSLTSLMRRFKSHDIYQTTNKPQPPPRAVKDSNKPNEGTTITINLNLPQTNVKINNYSQNPKNSKRVFSEKHSGNNKKPLDDNPIRKETVSLNHYTNNTSRIRNQVNTMKILNEESIQELDTEENFNAIDDKRNESYFSGSINESTPSKENKVKAISTIPLFQNKFLEEINADGKNGSTTYEESYDSPFRKLIIAAKKGDKEKVLEVIEVIMNDNKGIGLNFQDENGWNAMHYACDEGNLKIVEILVKTSIDLNNKTNDKKTPLHLAAGHGYFDISKLLIENDALIHCLDNERNTPIHLCVLTNHIELLKFLCERSKNIDSRNIYGKTPFDLSTNEEVKSVLKFYGEKQATQQMINVKIHTTNSKQANTLIKHLNCQGSKTPLKFINYTNDIKCQSSNSNAHTTTTNATANAGIRSTTSKNKFNNNIQNNNININISTNLCNISHHNSKQFKRQEKVNVVVDSRKSNQLNTIKTTSVNNTKGNRPEIKSTTEVNQKMRPIKDKRSSTKRHDSNCVVSKKKKDSNDRSICQSLNKNQKLFNHKASSMPHKEEGSRASNSQQKNSHCNNQINKQESVNKNFTTGNFKSLSKDALSTQRRDKSVSCKTKKKIPNKRDSGVRVANVEITLDQGDTFQKEPEKASNEEENQITSFANLSEERLGLDNEDNDQEVIKPDKDEEESVFDTINKTSHMDNSLSNEERIGPNSFISLALLGKGSFGEVYLVKKKNAESLYAMKVLDKDKIMGQNIVKYAMTERNVLSLTSHPFIVKLNYAFQTNEKLFLLLDYCPGGDLAEKLTSETRFSEEQAKIYLCEIILALGNLHQKNIIFRDLKPDNIVLDAEGHAMLTDFGLSREGVFDAKIAKSFCGSIAYLAPEMLSRKGHGKAVDWYLLGVLFFEMLVGIPPYFTNSKEQIFKNIQAGKLEIPRWVSPKAAKLIRQLLQKEPSARLGSRNDVDELKENEYFQNVNWDMVYNRQLKPPIPTNVPNAIHKFKQPKLFSDRDDAVDETGLLQKFEGWSFIQSHNDVNNECN